MKRLVWLWALLAFVIGGSSARAQWQHVGLDSAYVYAVFAKHDTVVAWAHGAVEYFSSDGGGTWSNRGSGPPHPRGWIMSVAPSGVFSTWYAVVDSADSNNFPRPRALYVSTDAGESWDLRSDFRLLGERVITNLYVSWANPDVLFALWGWTEYTAELHRSTDGGRTWENIDHFAGITQERITFAQDRVDSNLLFVHDDDGYSGMHFYASTDGGDSWREASPPPFDSPFALVSGIPSRGVVTAVIGDEVQSSNAGGTWTPLNQGLNPLIRNSNIQAYIVGAGDFHLRFALSGRGDALLHRSDSTAWESLFPRDTTKTLSIAWDDVTHTLYGGTEHGVVKWELPTGVSEERASPPDPNTPGVFPNPALHEASVVTDRGSGSYVRVDVLSAVGRTVDVQMLASSASGMITVRLGDLPAGVYYCTFSTQNGQRTIRVVHMK